jgi:NAD(P)H-hydrate repair Nnr-like enzyme with NAD(P)H-hydrate epimerase domain
MRNSEKLGLPVPELMLQACEKVLQEAACDAENDTKKEAPETEVVVP